MSEIDKYIKTMVLTDAFKVLTCGLDSVPKLGSFERLYPPAKSKDKHSKAIGILDKVRMIFESLNGSKEYSSLTLSQFMKLPTSCPTFFLSKALTKQDYELMFQ